MDSICAGPSTSAGHGSGNDGAELVEATKQLLADIESNGDAVGEFVERFVAKVNDGRLTTSKGISFLEMKNFTLLSYLIDLTYLVLRKCQGQSIEDNQAIDRLVETRTVLEKMKPIHFKLKYRIDKLVRSANSGTVDSNDPLRLKPRPDNLMVDDEPDDNEGSEMEEEDEEQTPKTSDKAKKAQGIYVAPKVTAMHYDEDDEEARTQKVVEKAKRRAFSASVIQELRSEFDEAPEEIMESSVGRKRQNKVSKERQSYEEEYMVRLNVPKKQRAQENKQGFVTMSSLSHDLTRFENISILDRDGVDGPTQSKKKKTTKGKKPGKFGKKKSKFRKFKK